MVLIEEIIALATDNKKPVSVVLRKMLVLAFRLSNDALKEWVTKELNGYLESDELPEYRRLQTHSLGTFSGPMGSSIVNQPLPLATLSPEHRKIVENADLFQAISAYESLLAGEGGTLQSPWNPNLTMLYQSKFYKGYALASAWRVIPAGHLTALIDTVRNRILQFALEMEAPVEKAGQDLERVPQSTVSTHVTNIIYGGSNVVSTGSDATVQFAEVNVTAGSMSDLTRALQSVGLDDVSVAELRGAIADDQASNPKLAAPGPKSSSWLSSALAKVGTETLKVGTDVARTAITKALFSYYGL